MIDEKFRDEIRFKELSQNLSIYLGHLHELKKGIPEEVTEIILNLMKKNYKEYRNITEKYHIDNQGSQDIIKNCEEILKTESIQ